MDFQQFQHPNMMGQMNFMNNTAMQMMPPNFQMQMNFMPPTNYRIYHIFRIINKYIFYMQNCILIALKGNDYYLYNHLSDFLNIFWKYYNDLKQIDKNSSFGINDYNNFNFKSLDEITSILAKINIDINKFLCLLYGEKIFKNNSILQIIIGSNLFNYDINKNDYCIILYILNEFISGLQKSVFKIIEIIKSKMDFSEFIKNIENFYNEIYEIIPINNFMQPSEINNFQMNQNPNSTFQMSNPFLQRNIMNNSNNIYNNNISIIKDEINYIYKIKSTISDFLCELNPFAKLNMNPYIEGSQYFETIEVNKENNNIIEKISKKVFNYIKLDEEQKKKDLEIEGKFLYSIGGVARISLNISNKLYSEIFQKYKIYLNDPRKINGNRLDNKNLSCWAKNSFNLKEFIQNSAVKYGNEISRYYKFLKYQEDRYFLFEIFNDFLSLFLKCSLSIPLVEVKFLDDKNILDKPIDNQEMIDLIIKNRIYKVNFCFLPQLTSNDGLIPGAKFHVFTYNEPETYKHPVIDYEIVRQKTELDY